jgi:hypothetical protein
MIKTLAGPFVCLILVCILITEGGAFAAGTEEKEKAALPAAESWLKLVDSRSYAESWKTAADYFKNNVKRDQWEQAMKGFREPLGKVSSRTVKNFKYATSLPGAPDGEYVIIQYQTSFENKKWATETITPMLEKDGSWRVSGYFIN